MITKNLKKYAAENPDLAEIYEAKIKALSIKHVSKNRQDCADSVQKVLNMLEKRYALTQAVSNENWLLGAEFTQADQVAAVWL
jgi:hypothetical protein